MQATLSVVGTPIGNMEDITARAVRTLSVCDVILCEDTRVTRKLLARLGIERPLVSFHAHSGIAKYDKVFDLLDEGKHVSLVTDAGMPSISDPGAQLVAATRARYEDTVAIETIPGPSAVSAALSVSGLSGDTYTFSGFPPHKKGRKTFFDRLASAEHTTVFFESPHRIVKALESLRDRLDPAQSVAVCRELTKMHEEVVVGSAAYVHEYFTAHTDHVRGEFVVIVSEKRV